jgi:hypothetical protein
MLRTRGTRRPRKPEPPAGLSLREAVGFLERLAAQTASSGSWISPFLREAEGAGGWYVAARSDAPDGSSSLQVFVWPPGSWTKVHDHASWGALVCAAGSVVEDRYVRLDDGSVLEHARLRLAWSRAWSPEDGASTVQPGDGGIHRVGNPGETAAVSIHLYGPRLREADGRDYDPSRDYVCDRFDED